MIENTVKYIGFRNAIYRRMDGYWLKVSPWKKQEERRLLESEFHKGDKYYVIPTKNVNHLLNEMFNSFEDTWWYKGVFFKTKVNDTILNTKDHPKLHNFNIYPFFAPFYLVYRHGNLYWAQSTPDGKYRLYEFIDENEKPGKFRCYCSGNSLKPIYKCGKNWEVI